jgi:hypothetical protein
MPEDKPNRVYPTSPISTPSQMPMYNPDSSIAGHSFDDLLKNRGIRMIHAKALPCANILTLDSNAHEPNCTFCNNNGFQYYDSKEIWGIFSGNSMQKTFEAHGVWEIGSAQITMPTEYPDGTEADFNAFDKLTIPDFTVRLWELKEYEPRPGNIQELRYPIEKVDRTSSILAQGKVEKIYTPGIDFNINTQGQIVWIDGRQPAYDAREGHGEVIAWSFYANPVYLVVQTLRELRITQEMVNGQKIARRLPQQLLVKRDFLPDAGETIVKP